MDFLPDIPKLLSWIAVGVALIAAPFTLKKSLREAIDTIAAFNRRWAYVRARSVARRLLKANWYASDPIQMIAWVGSTILRFVGQIGMGLAFAVVGICWSFVVPPSSVFGTDASAMTAESPNVHYWPLVCLTSAITVFALAGHWYFTSRLSLMTEMKSMDLLRRDSFERVNRLLQRAGMSSEEQRAAQSALRQYLKSGNYVLDPFKALEDD